jgi:predicted DCC family thiol-disulfide oxidoreductase YuxK
MDATFYVLFDGVCNLCNSSVQFIIRNDRRGRFRFAALQSEAGRELLLQYQLPEKALNTVVLIAGGRAFTRSTAALEIARRLDGAWPICYAAVALPRFLRDSAYDFHRPQPVPLVRKTGGLYDAFAGVETAFFVNLKPT